MQARSQDLEKGGGSYFQKVRKVQTTLTRIFIVLESVSHGLSEIETKFLGKLGNSKVFSAQNQVVSKKKKSSLKLTLIFRPEFEIRRFVPPKIRWSTKKRSSLKLRLIFRPNSEIETFEGGCFPMGGGGLFLIFHKKSASKHQKRAILHTSQANGGARAPPPAPLATLLQ